MSFATVAINNVSKSFGPKPVLVDISFTLGPHTRMGVVGRNGSGKSTLLKVIAGIESHDVGSVVYMPPSASIGYLPQTSIRSNETVDEFLLGRTGVQQANDDLERTATVLADGTVESQNAYEVALERYVTSGAADFDARATTALKDVGLPEKYRRQPMNSLSGGQAAKAALAAILLSRFDLLLLDEPTNDLDFRGLELLEQFALRSEAGMLIVSHDRAFVERTTTSILEIDEHHHTAREFGGGWEAYERERSAVRDQAETSYSNFSAQKDQLKSRAQQQRQWSDKGVAKSKNPKDNDKFVKNWGAATSEKQAAKARQTERALDRLDQVDKPWEGWQLQMHLPTTSRAGDIVAKLTNAVVDRGDFKLGPINEEIGWAERVAIVGPNGSGKTTLLSALLRELPLTSGDSFVGPGVTIGRIDQLRTVLGADRPLAEVFIDASGLVPAEARSLLAKFDLGGRPRSSERKLAFAG